MTICFRKWTLLGTPDFDILSFTRFTVAGLYTLFLDRVWWGLNISGKNKGSHLKMRRNLASGFVLYLHVFVVGPNKRDCSRRSRLRGNFCLSDFVPLADTYVVFTGILHDVFVDGASNDKKQGI
jgi:hypothetical protein